MEDLIYDRLSSDVDLALNNPNSTTNLKGAYNYTDLNRVESWCEYLQNIFAKFGFTGNLTVKTDWSMTDYPTRTQMDRIRKNIDTLKNFCISISTETIVYNNTMNYEQANILEKILYDVYEYFLDLQRQMTLSYNIGVILIRKKFVSATADNSITTEKRNVNMNVRVGATLIKEKYIILNVKEE